MHDKDKITEGEYLSETLHEPSLHEIGMEHDYPTDEAFWMSVQYDSNKNANVNSQINCACCNNVIVKTTYHKQFCNNKCKDRFWNSVDEDRMERAKIFNR